MYSAALDPYIVIRELTVWRNETDASARERGQDRGAAPAIEHINLEFRFGEFVGIVGASGGGKTTLGRMFDLWGERREGWHRTSGEILVAGRDNRTIDWMENALYLQRVIQEEAVFPGSIYDNISLGPRRLLGIRDKTELQQRVKEALRAVGLEGIDFNRNASELSGGQRMRVHIARALACGTPALILDEPTAPLDRDTRQVIGKTLIEYSKNPGRLVILITHDRELAAQTTRLIQLDQGRVVNDGPSRDVLNKLSRTSVFQTAPA